MTLSLGYLALGKGGWALSLVALCRLRGLGNLTELYAWPFAPECALPASICELPILASQEPVHTADNNSFGFVSSLAS